ncbi:MAG: C40 family peptidase [Lactobacillaceae bacterium]|jgi:cell wall-associated NlpC family hydrolase|nr:C40 family peptidase [Lactobacillaceae bacterium]
MVSNKLKKQALAGVATVSAVGVGASVASAMTHINEPITNNATTNVKVERTSAKSSFSSSNAKKSVAQALNDIDLNTVAVPTPAQQTAEDVSKETQTEMVAATDAPQQVSAPVAAEVQPVVEVAAAPVQETVAQTKEYTVVSGDSLWSIATQYGITVDQLVAANGGQTLITVGQVLQIPSADAQVAEAAEVAQPVQEVENTDSVQSEAPVVDQSQQDVSSEAPVVDSSSDDANVSNEQVVVEQPAQTEVVTPEVSAPVDSQAPEQTAPSQPEVTTPQDTTPSQPAATAPSTPAATTPSAPAQTTPSTDTNVQKVIALAQKLATQNIPYVWGGSTLQGFDCSGFTQYVFQQATGKYLPHNTVMQEGYITKKSVSSAKPGDLLFWGSAGATYHVGIYIGNNQFIAAPQPGMNVSVQTLASSWMPSFAGTVN